MTSSIAKMHQIITDCDRRIAEIKDTMAYKELKALEAQKEWTNEKLIKTTGIGKIGGKQE